MMIVLLNPVAIDGAEMTGTGEARLGPVVAQGLLRGPPRGVEEEEEEGNKRKVWLELL